MRFWAEMKAPRVGGWKRRYEAGGGWLCTGRSAGATQDWLLLMLMLLLLLLLLLSQRQWVAGSRLGRWRRRPSPIHDHLGRAILDRLRSSGNQCVAAILGSMALSVVLAMMLKN